MATILKKKSDLKRKRTRFRILSAAAALPVPAILIWAFREPSALIPSGKNFGSILPIILFFAGIAALLGLSGYFRNYARQLSAGISGEEQSLQLMKGLPDRYTVIQNLQLQVNGKPLEIDHLVIGDTGLFIVEAKNYRGTLTGNCSDRELTKEKIARKNAYSQKVKNPVFQVRREVSLLRQYLDSHGCGHYVNGFVCFVNPDFDYQVKGRDPYVEVFSANCGGPAALKNRILSGEDRNMTPEKMQRILHCLR